MTEIKPALSKEEWGCEEFDYGYLDPGLTVQHPHDPADMDAAYINVPTDAQHGLAALALYRQPFGFTREDVRILRVAAQAYDEDPFYFRELEPPHDNYPDESPVPQMYRSLADRIEALLPPE